MTRDVSDDMRAGCARAVLTVDGIGRFAAAGVVLASDKILRRADPSLKSRLLLAGARLTTSALLLRGAARKRPRSKDLLCAATVNLGWVLACTISHRSTPTQAGDNSWPPPPFSMGPVVVAAETGSGRIQRRMSSTPSGRSPEAPGESH